MGIKGRRKKLRQREELARQQQEQGGHAQEYGSEDDDGLAGRVFEMGECPFHSPVDAMGRLRMKKSET